MSRAYHRIKALGLCAAAELRIMKNLSRSIANTARPSFDANRAMVRRTARSINLARGFLKGLQHHGMEQPLRKQNKGHVAMDGFTRTMPDWDEILDLVLKFGRKTAPEQVLRQTYAEWRDHAVSSAS